MKKLKITRKLLQKAIMLATLAVSLLGMGKVGAAPTSQTITPNDSTVWSTPDGGISWTAAGVGSGAHPVTASFIDTRTTQPTYNFTIQSGANLTTTSSYFIEAKNVNAFNNLGNISSTHSGGYSVGLGGSGTYAVINNFGIISATSSVTNHTNSGAYGIYIGTSLGTLSNSGTISGTGTSSVTNSSYGVQSNGSVGSLTNSGTIIGTENTSNNVPTVVTANSKLHDFVSNPVTSGYGVYVGTTLGSLTNSGLIIGKGGTKGYGVYAGNSIGSLVNSGTISGTYSSYTRTNLPGFQSSIIIPFVPITYGTGLGVYSGGTIGNLDNSGTISGIAPLVRNAPVVVVNSGVSPAAVEQPFGAYLQSYGAGVYAAKSIDVLSNSGTISGTSKNKIYGDGFGVYSGTTINTLTNSGTIIGTTSATGYQVAIVTPSEIQPALSPFNNVAQSLGVGVYSAASLETLFNTGSITGTGLTGYGVYSGGTIANLINTGSITGTTDGIYSAKDSTITLNSGSTLSGGSNALLVDAVSVQKTSNVTVNGRSYLTGALHEEKGIGSLYLNLVGLTPEQLAKLQYDQAHNITTDTVTAGLLSYSYINFHLNASHAVSLEEVVDRKFYDLAVKIDSLGLPVGFDGFFNAALNDPQGAMQVLTGRTTVVGLDQIKTNINTQINNELGNQIDQQLNGDATGGFDASNFNISDSNLLAFNSANSTLDHLTDVATMSDIGGTSLCSGHCCRNCDVNNWGTWLSGTVTFAHQSVSQGQPGYNAVNGTPTLGASYKLNPDLVVGAFTSFTTGDAKFGDSSRIQANSEFLGGFAGWKKDHWKVRGNAAVGLAQYKNQRTTFDGSANSSPDGYDVVADTTAGYEINLPGKFKITPQVGVGYSHVYQDGYNEGGSIYALSVEHQDIDSLRSHVGFNLTREFQIAHNLQFNPDLHAAWYHEFMDDSRSVNAGFENAPAIGNFGIKGVAPERDFALVGVGMSTAFTGYALPVGLFINYDIQAGQTSYMEQNVNGGVRISF